MTTTTDPVLEILAAEPDRARRAVYAMQAVAAAADRGDVDRVRRIVAAYEEAGQ